MIVVFGGIGIIFLLLFALYLFTPEKEFDEERSDEPQ